LTSAAVAARLVRPHDAPYHMVCAGATHTGMHREHNEDRLGIFPDVGLFVVADGMGGAAGGEVAAQMAVDLVAEAFLDPDVSWPLHVGAPTGRGLPLLIAAVRRANHCIHGAAQIDVAHRDMGTTIAALFVRGQRAALAHAGDSRVYRLRGHRLDLMTEDHSYFNAHVQCGKADPDRPEDFPFRNFITRALGLSQDVDVEGRVVEVQPGDTFLLCSDGLTGVLSHCEIAKILRDFVDLDEAAAQLIACANAGGGPDNITAVLLRVG
jgi:serine/threonine protein phosphatase PrpC